MKKILLITLSIIAVSLGFNTGSVFADEPEDITYTVNSSNYTSDHYLCNDSASCSGYNYLIVDWPGVVGTQYFTFSFNTGSLRVNSNQITGQYVYYLNNPTSVKFNGSSGTLASYFGGSGAADIQIKLSSSQGCPTCPEQLDPNRSPVMDDFHNVFINTMLSVIPITAIIFVVWFFIDMLSSLVFGRGK